MGKKILIYIAGIITGVILTFVFAYAITNNNDKSDDIKYFKNEISYEDKSSTSFKVFQVLDNYALANEKSEYNMYLGKIVLLISNDISFYSDQIIKVDNPKQIGTYSYESQRGMQLTVPVIDISK